MVGMSRLLSHLNKDQKKAALHDGGPALVLAGAGSGKTTVLTTRVAYLIEEKGVDPSSILLVTFTNKAAHEMNKRVMELTGSKLPMSGTFHSLCAKILRRHGHKIGLDNNYIIYDSDEQLTLIKQIYKKINLNTKEINPRAVLATISNAKNEMLTPQEYAQFATGNFQETVARVYKLYQKGLKDNHAVDFDDLLNLTNYLFASDKATLAKFQDQIEYVLVDEYQDTNKSQYQLTKYFTIPQNNLFVVGDFSQSIYAWRGADYRNMFHLKRDFPDLVEYRLEQNYRSTQSILDVATQVISKNSTHPILSLWTESTNNNPIIHIETNSGESEATEIIRRIKKLESEYKYSDIAILYRTNAQSRLFEEACVKNAIPYKLIGGFKFYERKEIKDVLAFLKVAINPQDTVSRQRAEKLGKRRFGAFKLALEGKDLSSMTPSELIETTLLASHYRDKFDDKDPEDADRLTNIEELLNVAAQFDDINLFLENVALVQDDNMTDLERLNGVNSITMMSLHSAKGLEFPVVFMAGMEEGLLPHSRSLLEKEQMEEERRLCYVGITRAKERLFFSSASQRYIYGSSSYSTLSRFLQDINPGLIKKESSVIKDYTKDNKWFYQPKKDKVPEKPKRRLVIDDDMLDSVLSGEMDVDSFLDF